MYRMQPLKNLGASRSSSPSCLQEGDFFIAHFCQGNDSTWLIYTVSVRLSDVLRGRVRGRRFPRRVSPPMSRNSPRRSKPEPFGRDLIDRWKASGLSVAAFYAAHQVGQATFYVRPALT